MSKNIPRLVLTPGEPAGIGPDICVLIAQEILPIELIVVADRDLLTKRAHLLGLPLQLNDFNPLEKNVLHQPGFLQIINETLVSPAEPGKLDKKNARYILNTLNLAIDGCLSGLFDAMVTGPIHKGIINEGLNKSINKTSAAPLNNRTPIFTGHTEYLAERTECNLPVMMLATNGLRVALVTTHLPLSSVSENITTNRLTQVIEILHRELVNRFSIEDPTILVCGLNPHAGEDGHLGKEEIEIITPVLNKLRKRGWKLTGPLPADTLFVPDKLKKADAIKVCVIHYHSALIADHGR